MYVPAHFQEKELDAIHQLVRDHSFGMLMVNGNHMKTYQVDLMEVKEEGKYQVPLAFTT